MKQYYEITQYVGEEGESIVAKTASNPEIKDSLEPKTVFVGTIPLRVGTPQGIMQIPFEFEFPQNLTLAQCFEQFDDIAKKEVAKKKAEMEDQNRIIPASAGSVPNLRVLPKT